MGIFQEEKMTTANQNKQEIRNHSEYLSLKERKRYCQLFLPLLFFPSFLSMVLYGRIGRYSF